MIPVVVLHATAIALHVELVWKEASAVVASDIGIKSDWPVGYCVEATISLRDELDEKLPEAGGEMVWGTFTAGVAAVVPLDHAWIELGAGHLLDITLSQFFRTEQVPILIQPEGPLFERYEARERTPSWADSNTPAHLIERLRA